MGIANLGQANTYTVTNLNNSGNGSLRWALDQAGSHSGSDTIKFNPALTGGTICPTSELQITSSSKAEETIIDASDIWNEATNMPGITIDGNCCGSCEGLNIRSKNCEIYGIAIMNFEDDCIQPQSGADYLILGGPGHKANVFGGCGGEGIELQANDCHIYGNYVGVTPNGADIGNGDCSKGLGGLVFCSGASDNVIEKNIFAHNWGFGTKCWSANNDDGNLITQNSFYQNKDADRNGSCSHWGLGIDHGASNGDGPTLNDGQKKSNEFNDGMDYPTFTTAELSADGNTLYVKGFVGTLPGQTVFANSRVEVFIADPDPTGFGEGKTYLATLTTGSTGNFEGTINVSAIGGFAVGDYITGTATDPNNSTSEFSPLLAVIPGC